MARSAASELRRRGRKAGPIRKGYELGARTVSWAAEVPADDRLRYRVLVQRVGEARWFPLANDLTDQFFSWDVRSMPDGRYQARLIGDDAQDNPKGKYLEHESISQLFTIDNTRPEVSGFRVRREAESLAVEFVLTDAGGRIAAVETMRVRVTDVVGNLGGDLWAVGRE